MPEEEAEAIEFGRLQALKRAKKKSYAIRGGLAAVVLIILALMFWNPGNQHFEPTTSLSAQFFLVGLQRLSLQENLSFHPQILS